MPKPNRLAVVKINMIGQNALILGLCRQLDDEDHWIKMQLFTFEEYLPGGRWGDADAGFQEIASERSKKYHGKVVQFESIPEPLEILQRQHSFSFADAKQIEITPEQREALQEEMSHDGWMDFDWETWGK